MIDLSHGGSRFPRAQEVREHLYATGGDGISGRFLLLDRLDAFYRCREYDHLKSDWNGQPADRMETISPLVTMASGGYVEAELGQAPPVRLRRPTAPLRMTPLIVDRFSDLLFGDKRRPDVTLEGDDHADDFLRTVFERAGFWSRMWLARTKGGSMGSVLVTTHLKEGRFKYRVTAPKCVHDVVWKDRDDLIPEAVLIQYRFTKPFEVVDDDGHPTGEIRDRDFVYRRIIDEEWDTVFKEAPVEHDGRPPEVMEVDRRQTVQHGLGRFPGVWIQNLPDDEEIDGIPDCWGTFEAMDTLDRLNSQANHGLIANLDPTLVVARDIKTQRLQGQAPIAKGSDNALDVGAGGSATYLEMAGSSVSAAREHGREIKGDIFAKTATVMADPERISGAAQSAMAIELMYEPMTAKAGRMRTQYGRGVQGLGEITLDMARLWSDKTRYPGNARVIFDLPKRTWERDLDPDHPDPDARVERVLLPRDPGDGGTVLVDWGAFFTPTPGDVQTIINTLGSAVGASLIDLETGVRKAALEYGIKDVEALIRRVREEVDSKKREREAFVSDGLGGMPDDDGSPAFEGGLGDLGGLAETLNGAQITSLLEILQEVIKGSIPEDAAVLLITSTLGLEERLIRPIIQGVLARQAAGAPSLDVGAPTPRPPGR